jgi:hypothetical protein
MGRIVQPSATRGSQHWLQRFVETCPARLDSAIGLGALEWLSPLESDDFSEYRDAGFLQRLGVELAKRPLVTFWPTGGPVWDGLARAQNGACVLIEAKAHIPEMASSCDARCIRCRARPRLVRGPLPVRKPTRARLPDERAQRGPHRARVHVLRGRRGHGRTDVSRGLATCGSRGALTPRRSRPTPAVRARCVRARWGRLTSVSSGLRKVD